MQADPNRFLIVGIGASAGGVEALQGLFRAIPLPLGMAFVVVTHLGRGHESALPAILSDCTAMPVSAAQDGMLVESGNVYVLPHDSIITVVQGRLLLRRQAPEAPRERQPIDVFFVSLAADQGEWAVGVVLSGSGRDGTLGLKAIKEGGGLTIAQGVDGTAPRYPEMPSSAVAGGTVDLILSVEEIPARLDELARSAAGLAATIQDPPAPQHAAARLAICAVLESRIGHDFSGYKEGTFFRRVQRRIQVLRLASIDAYVGYLGSTPDEAGQLFRDLLIGVTGFFRDPEAFTLLAERVIPTLFKDRGAEDTIRVWVPGCATGEEAYSLAILLGEYRAAHPGAPRVQVFATDIDDAALAVARAGRYPAALTAAIGAERLARWFVADGTANVVTRELRDRCVFSAHSVFRDAPFSRIDLISCRNLLIYLGGRLQDRVVSAFHYALRPEGLLFLGHSETLASHADLFACEDRGLRLFRRRGNAGLVASPSSAVTLPIAIAPAGVEPPPPRHRGGSALRQTAERFLCDEFVPPHVLVQADGDVVYQSAGLGKYLEPAAGVPSRKLLAMARRGLRLELRLALREAIETRQRVVRPVVEVEHEDRSQPITLTVAPLPAREGADPLFVVLFADQGPPQPKATIPPGSDDPPAEATVRQLERELRDTRERLLALGDQYETATEELKSSNEEMVSVNEELQSTNEELETSKEELQSVNEELRTANLDLAGKIDQLDRANADLRNLFDATQIGTVFLDDDLRIRSFTPAITAIFNLVTSDRGRALTDFHSWLDRVDLRQEVRRVLRDVRPSERRVTARAGTAHYLMRILPYRTAEGTVDGVVVTFVDVALVVEGEVLGTLVNELNHRVRNMLQLVLAVADSSLRRAGSLEDFGRSFRGRLRALSVAHELLSKQGIDAAALGELVLRELRPYSDDTTRISASGPLVMLSPKIALALGMVLHELATNATKHGALSGGAGRVAVTWTIAEAPPVAMVTLRWIELGGPAVAAPKRRGFGSELMERQLRHALGGGIDLEFAATGLRATLHFPLGAPSPVGPDRPSLPAPGEPTAPPAERLPDGALQVLD